MLRSSAALGEHHPAQRTFDQNPDGCGACVHIGHGNAERAGLANCPRQHTELSANQLNAGVRVCRQIHLSAAIRSIPARAHQGSRPQPVPGLQGPPHASVFWRNHQPAPRSVLWFQHGLETDLITFFRLHAVEPAACMITRVCTDFIRSLSLRRYWTRRLQSTGNNNVASSPQHARHGRSMAKYGWCRSSSRTTPSLYFQSSIDHLSCSSAAPLSMRHHFATTFSSTPRHTPASKAGQIRLPSSTVLHLSCTSKDIWVAARADWVDTTAHQHVSPSLAFHVGR
jgi:hypothetical protein